MIYSGRDVDQASGSSPRVEALNAAHLRLLFTSAQISSSNQWVDQPQALIPSDLAAPQAEGPRRC